MATASPPRKDQRVAVVTGGMGFIGSHLIKLLLDTDPELVVYNIDMGDYAAANGTRFAKHRHHAWSYPPADLDLFVRSEQFRADARHFWLPQDIVTAETDGYVRRLFSHYRPHVVYHLAAKSHVDRAIESPAEFVRTNVCGTQAMLELSRLSDRLEKFVYISTDEVYGSVARETSDGFTEESITRCGNPYSAAKAGGEQLALAYHNTYGLPAVITRGCNTYGEYQFPEKLIPLACRRVLRDLPVPVYGDGQQSRQWMHVRDHATGIIAAAEKGRPGEIYNLSTGLPVANIDIVKLILNEFGRPESRIQFVPDRPGHDRRGERTQPETHYDGRCNKNSRLRAEG